MQREFDPRHAGETGGSNIRIAPNFEPLYQLADADYMRIINGLATLILASLGLLQAAGQEELARLIAGRAEGILEDYDPDIAELMACAGSPGAGFGEGEGYEEEL